MSNRLPTPLESYRPRPDLLAERVILVTGAASGVGREVARTLAAHGAQLVLLDRLLPALESLDDEIRAQDLIAPALYPLNLEAAGYQDFERLAGSMAEAFSRLDGLVHCAAVLGDLAPVHSYDPTTWARVFQTNLHAPFMLTQTCLPMLEACVDASVIFSSDQIVRQGRAYWGAYATSKAAVETLMQVLADECARRGTPRVNSLDPGPVRTGLRAAAYPAEDPLQIPLAQSVANAYLYLVGPDSSDVHGQALRVHQPTQNHRTASDDHSLRQTTASPGENK